MFFWTCPLVFGSIRPFLQPPRQNGAIFFLGPLAAPTSPRAPRRKVGNWGSILFFSWKTVPNSLWMAANHWNIAGNILRAQHSPPAFREYWLTVSQTLSNLFLGPETSQSSSDPLLFFYCIFSFRMFFWTCPRLFTSIRQLLLAPGPIHCSIGRTTSDLQSGPETSQNEQNLELFFIPPITFSFTATCFPIIQSFPAAFHHIFSDPLRHLFWLVSLATCDSRAVHFFHHCEIIPNSLEIIIGSHQTEPNAPLIRLLCFISNMQLYIIVQTFH